LAIRHTGDVNAAAIPSDQRQTMQLLAAGRLRKTHIHHDNAGDEPGRHQKADRNTEVAVRDDQCSQ
jgi:hypothetical protein